MVKHHQPVHGPILKLCVALVFILPHLIISTYFNLALCSYSVVLEYTLLHVIILNGMLISHTLEKPTKFTTVIYIFVVSVYIIQFYFSHTTDHHVRMNQRKYILSKINNKLFQVYHFQNGMF